MGKRRNRPNAPVLQNETTADDIDDLRSPPVPATQRAVNGYNVDGWTDEDIQTYNELLLEREKLEKEKNELEKKSLRHETERALLNENATTFDSLFKSHSGGRYKYTGSGNCCLDFDASELKKHAGASRQATACTHELCKRAKSMGISWTEMDTVKYYQTRIDVEKSQRMKNALRKQRDVELVRVAKDEEEEAMSRPRNSPSQDAASRSLDTKSVKAPKQEKHDCCGTGAPPSSFLEDLLLDPNNKAILDAAKENEHVVREIKAHLNKIRQDINSGRISPHDARKRLDQANKEMAKAEKTNNAFRQMILDTEPALGQPHSATDTLNLSKILSNSLASSAGDAFSQALNVMKDFFSASNPQHIQSAISDLRNILEINGPLSPVLQQSFETLEDMLSKPLTKPFAVNIPTSDGGTKTCTNVAEVLLEYRDRVEKGGPIPKELKLDEATIKANGECQKIEADAVKRMDDTLKDLKLDKETVMSMLRVIKDSAVKRSPIPPLSDIVLEEHVYRFEFGENVKRLVLHECKESTGEKALAGQITSMIMTYTKRKPEDFMSALNTFTSAIGLAKKDPPEIFLDALSNVHTRMIGFVKLHATKNKKIESTPPTAQEQQSPQNADGRPSEQHSVMSASELLAVDIVDGIFKQMVEGLRRQNHPSPRTSGITNLEKHAHKLLALNIGGYDAEDEVLLRREFAKMTLKFDLKVLQKNRKAKVEISDRLMDRIIARSGILAQTKQSEQQPQGQRQQQLPIRPSANEVAPGSPASDPSPAPATKPSAINKATLDETPLSWTARELTVRDQLTTFFSSIAELRITRDSSETHPVAAQYLDGVIKSMEATGDNHLVMARLVADESSLRGLGAWLAREYRA